MPENSSNASGYEIKIKSTMYIKIDTIVAVECTYNKDNSKILILTTQGDWIKFLMTSEEYAKIELNRIMEFIIHPENNQFLACHSFEKRSIGYTESI